MRPWFWEGCEQGRTFATHMATSRSQTPWEVLGWWGTEAPGHESGEWQGRHPWLPLRTEASERQGGGWADPEPHPGGPSNRPAAPELGEQASSLFCGPAEPACARTVA